MSIPILVNRHEYIQALRAGETMAPDCQQAESLVDMTEGRIRAVTTQLRDVMNIIRRDNGSVVSFDGPAARVLHEDLRLDRFSATEQRFWSFLSAVKMPDIVRWRFGKDESPPPTNRFNGGWKDTFRRLWFRAAAGHDPSLDDPYEYVVRGGEDFWVGLIEREVSECSNLVRALLPFWLNAADQADRTMKAHRRFFIALRLLRPYRAYEAMMPDELTGLLMEAEKVAAQEWIEDFE